MDRYIRVCKVTACVKLAVHCILFAAFLAVLAVTSSQERLIEIHGMAPDSAKIFLATSYWSGAFWISYWMFFAFELLFACTTAYFLDVLIQGEVSTPRQTLEWVQSWAAVRIFIIIFRSVQVVLSITPAGAYQLAGVVVVVLVVDIVTLVNLSWYKLMFIKVDDTNGDNTDVHCV